MHAAVERAIATMWERYEEKLSLDDLADSAFLSKFYFSRIFRALTGTSPGRFLSAIRLHKAKNHLLETDSSVTEISYRVGYNSLGTFTSRFTRSVGLSPARYRNIAHAGFPPAPNTTPVRDALRYHDVRGKVSIPDPTSETRIYVGAFNNPIAEGLPVACDVLEGPGEYFLDSLPDGVWHLRAAVVAMRDIDPLPWNRQPLFVGAGQQPVTVRSGHLVSMDLDTRPLCRFDLPILLALPELDCWQVPVPRLTEKVPG